MYFNDSEQITWDMIQSAENDTDYGTEAPTWEFTGENTKNWLTVRPPGIGAL